jgi:hypothetical protein
MKSTKKRFPANRALEPDENKDSLLNTKSRDKKIGKCQ